MPACKLRSASERRLTKSKSLSKTNVPVHSECSESENKRRKVAPPQEGIPDALDPVEKLLSFSNYNSDILTGLEVEVEDSYDEDEDEDVSAGSNIEENRLISLNFSKILNDRLSSYYSSRSPIDLYNDNSSFAILNKGNSLETEESLEPTTPSNETPFLRNVNFNPSYVPSYTLDQYLAYDDDDEIEEGDPKGTKEIAQQSMPKMSFRYRDNKSLNLNLVSDENNREENQYLILNQRSVLSGKASEMISSGRFLINDFLL